MSDDNKFEVEHIDSDFDSKFEIEKLKSQITSKTDSQELKAIEAMFNLAIKKKELLRKDAYSEFKDKLMDQVDKRLTTHPDEFSNKDLLDYLRTFDDLLNKDTSLDTESIAAIQLNNPTQININVGNGQDSLTQEEKNRVSQVVRAILDSQRSDTIIDCDVKEKKYDN